MAVDTVTELDTLTSSPDSAEFQREMEEITAAMRGELDAAPEPGSLHPRDMIHRGDTELPTPMMAHTITSGGYCWIYDSITGDRSLTNMNMLPAQLKKKRPDGSFLFVTKKPARTPILGTLKCLLHPEHPDRAKWEQLGFLPCQKENIPSEYMVEEHMRTRHKVAWATIQRQREREREDQRWALEQAILHNAARGVAAVAAENVAAEPVANGRTRKQAS